MLVVKADTYGDATTEQGVTKLLNLDLAAIKPRAHVSHQVGPIDPGVPHFHDVLHDRSLNIPSMLGGSPASGYDLRQCRVSQLDTGGPPCLDQKIRRGEAWDLQSFDPKVLRSPCTLQATGEALACRQNRELARSSPGRPKNGTGIALCAHGYLKCAHKLLGVQIALLS
jgi:hypothetical protein